MLIDVPHGGHLEIWYITDEKDQKVKEKINIPLFKKDIKKIPCVII